MLSPTSHHRRGPHNHQRIGPGANIHRERDPERDWELQQQLEYERTVEREREAQRAVELRHRLAMEAQEEAELYAEEEARARGLSRSGSPGSAVRAGGSRDVSLPAPGQAHDHERGARGYASPHVSHLLGADRDRDRERDADERAHALSRDRGAPGASELGAPSAGDSRKRNRDEMDVDDRYEAEGRAVRGGKRAHSEDDGSVGRSGSGKGDSLPDERMDEA